MLSRIAWISAFVGLTLHLVPLLSAEKSDAHRQQTAALPVFFEENRGQLGPSTRYLARNAEGAVQFTSAGPEFLLRAAEGSRAVQLLPMVAGHSVTLRAEDAMPGTVNYFVGNEASAKFQGILTYGKLRYRDFMPGVNLTFYGSGHALEHDFELSPGVDPASVRFRLSGAKAISLNPLGELEVKTATSRMLFRKPTAYQTIKGRRTIVPVRFALNHGSVVSFNTGKYDKTTELVIDPVLVFSTYLDGSYADVPSSITTDPAGNIYVAGSTASQDFPAANASPSPCDLCREGGGEEGYLAKLDPTGQKLLYSTFFVNNAITQIDRVKIDNTGNIVCAGYTASNNFPHVGNYAGSYTNGLFVFSLNPSGTLLNHSEIVGQVSTTYGAYGSKRYDLALDASRNVYVAGTVFANPSLPLNFPVTPGSYGSGQSNPAASDELFVAKIGADGSLVYSTIIPPVISSFAYLYMGGLAVDANGDAYVSGTAQAGMPTTADSVSPSFPNDNPVNGAYSGEAGFVLALNPAGSQLLFSTYLPGTDNANTLALASDGSLYVAGTTSESTLPVSANAYQPALRKGESCTCNGGYLLRLNATGTQVLNATYLSGTNDANNTLTAYASTVFDAAGNVYVGGVTASPDFPMINPVVTSLDFTGNQFAGGTVLAALSPDLSHLLFSSYFNGDGAGSRLADMATNGNRLILTGGTYANTNFPTTIGALQPNAPAQVNPGVGYQHEFVASIDLSIAAPSMCFDKQPIFFGPVLVNTVATATVNVRNCGNAALNVASVASSDPTVTATQNCSAIPPGGSCQVQLAYNPATTSSMTGTLALSGDTTISPQLVNVFGSGATPSVNIFSTIQFYDLLVGQTGSVNGLILQNSGTGPFILSSASVSGDFQIIQNTCNAPVAVKSSCEILINFSPTAAGTRTGVLNLADNLNPATQTVTLTGNGLTTTPAPAIGMIPAVWMEMSASNALTVNGTGFFPNSTILWNGNPRTTHYDGEGTLKADLLPADLQQPGEAQVTVATPAPGGGTSAAVTATVYGYLAIPVNSEVFEPHSQLIYATTPKGSFTNANSVVAIDPVTMQVTKTILTGNGPDSLAVSDDGSLLYVGLDDLYSVTQVALQSGAQNFTVTLPPVTTLDNLIGSHIVASGLKVVPGQPHTWVVGLGDPSGGEPNGLGVAVFDDATMRPTEAFAPLLTADSFAFVNDPTVVYSTEFNQLPPDISAYKITADGITRTGFSASVYGVGGSPLESDGSLIYDGFGHAIDPSTLITKTTYPQPNGAFALDTANQRLYFFGPAPVGSYKAYPSAKVLSAVGQTTGSTLGQIVFLEVPYQKSMERFGANGIAINEGGAWLFLQTSLTGTTVPTTAYSVTSGSLSFAMQTQGTTSAAQQVTLTNTGTAPVTFSGISITGDYSQTNTCGTSLPVSMSCIIDVSFAPTAPGDRSGALTIAGNAPGSPQSISLDGTGVSASAPIVSIAVSPQSLSFGSQAQGTTSAVQQVTLRNTGTAAFPVSAISVAGDYSQTNTCGTSLPVSMSCVIDVSFTPAAAGDRSGQLTISDNAPGSPQTITLDGTGVAPASAVTLSAQNSGGESATLTSGGDATYELNVSTTAYTGTVAISCSGAPTNSICAVKPANLNVVAGTTTPIVVTVGTAQPSQASFTGPLVKLGKTVPAIRGAGLGLLGLLSVPVLFSLRRRWKHFTMSALVGILITSGTVGCGGGSAQKDTPTSLVTPGTYTLTITVSANNQKATQLLTLIVK